jgi:hypothetical protein
MRRRAWRSGPSCLPPRLTCDCMRAIARVGGDPAGAFWGRSVQDRRRYGICWICTPYVKTRAPDTLFSLDAGCREQTAETVCIFRVNSLRHGVVLACGDEYGHPRLPQTPADPVDTERADARDWSDFGDRRAPFPAACRQCWPGRGDCEAVSETLTVGSRLNHQVERHRDRAATRPEGRPRRPTHSIVQ